MSTAPKISRCAIYTRKSTDHNLDLEFNSLDAQREACEAYIRSQAHEGWRLNRDRYDDGAFSGASLDRPALRALLADIEAGKIDTVVVYKVDRLTRSLTDFAKLVELFDEHNASFVSITQAFNTTNSMGRLTLNVLLSFAQFEREVIGERVRDKIAASKKKGMWMGGPVPLGYTNIDKKLVIVPEEAETVDKIFRSYLELRSIATLAEGLEAKGIFTKVRPRAKGTLNGGARFGVGALAHLLRNRLYIGEVVYGGEIYRGEHEPILDRSLFEAVQDRLKSNGVERAQRLRASTALLAGRFYDSRGNRMTPSHSNKRGVRYRYYVSQAVLQKKSGAAPEVKRVSAPHIEVLVVEQICRQLEIPPPLEAEEVRDLIECNLNRVVVTSKGARIHFVDGRAHHADANDKHTDFEQNGTPPLVEIDVDWKSPNATAAKGITRAPVEQGAMAPCVQEAMLGAIAKARLWVDELTTGRVGSFHDIARRENKGEKYVRALTALAFASPRMVQMIAAGRVERDLTVTSLVQNLPDSWRQQSKLISNR